MKMYPLIELSYKIGVLACASFAAGLRFVFDIRIAIVAFDCTGDGSGDEECNCCNDGEELQSAVLLGDSWLVGCCRKYCGV